MEKEEPIPAEESSGIFKRRSGRLTTTWSFGRKGTLPAKVQRQKRLSRKRRKPWLTGVLVILIGTAAWFAIRQIRLHTAVSALNTASFTPLDADYRAASDGSLCALPEIEAKAVANPEIVSDIGLTRRPQTDGRRPFIDLDQIVYYEKMTQNRVRVLYHDGSCDIYRWKELLQTIQQEEACQQFQSAPRDGVATEYINLHYITFFEKVKCASKELYRARLGLAEGISPDCATGRMINDFGVGLFSVYVYRKLRHLMEELNPHVDYRYRRVVMGGECL